MENKLTSTVSITQSETYTPEILDLLKKTLWGTPGGTQYKHIGTENTIADIQSPEYFSLERFGKLLCTVCLSGRHVNIGENIFQSSYVRYLASNPTITGKGDKNKHHTVKEHHGMIKSFMDNVFSQGANTDNNSGKKSLYYAYVESDNEQSLNLCSCFGFKSVRRLTTLLFSRFYPKTSPRVRRAVKNEYDEIRNKIAKQYSSHNFLYLGNIFYRDNFFVAEEGGKIVAGVQSNPMSWSFKNLPGFSGKIILKVLPHLPLLKKLFNPVKFDFCAMEGIFCEEGYEWILNELFETVINIQGRNTAMIWLDVNCPFHKKIRKHCRLGVMDFLNSAGYGEIIVRGENLSEKEWEELRTLPMYLSCFDFN